MGIMRSFGFGDFCSMNGESNRKDMEHEMETGPMQGFTVVPGREQPKLQYCRLRPRRCGSS